MLWPGAHLLCLLATAMAAFAADQRCWRSFKCSGPAEAAFKGPWESNMFSPSERMVKPKKTLTAAGNVVGNFYAPIVLKGNGSTVVLDFGYEVGGIVSLEYRSTGPGRVGLAFSESKNWIGHWSDSSNGKFQGPDGAVYFIVAREETRTTKYVVPDKYLRGGFRYLTLFLISQAETTAIQFSDIQLEIAFQPTWSNLKAYQGYFHSSDELLNRIWYSGAYTLQTNCVPPSTGRQVPMLSKGWANNSTMGPGDTIIVDGAKRDRAVWPGDMGIAVPSIFVSTGDLESIRNALQVIYDYQNSDGSFPEAGPPLLQQGSDTYHMWTLIGTYNYILYSDDIPFAIRNWPKFIKAMQYTLGKVKENGLLRVTSKRDWARWEQGGENSEANMILYQTLVTAAKLARLVQPGDPVATRWESLSKSLQTAINTRLYDGPARAFKDNTSRTSLHPQDANAFAILFEVVPPAQAQDISRSLLRNWTPIGAETPELAGNISPFITSFELQAHFSLRETARALDLMKRTWGWYLNHPNGSQSTMIEGYRTDGTFGYRYERGYGRDPSYVSHAHGWSAGPTSALTNYIAGLSILGRAGYVWSVKPQFDVLQFAEAGFTTKLGKFSTKWTKNPSAKGYDVTINTPKGTTGIVSLPALSGDNMAVLINGTAPPWKEGPTGMDFQLPGGGWTISVRAASESPVGSPQSSSSSRANWVLLGLDPGGTENIPQ